MNTNKTNRPKPTLANGASGYLGAVGSMGVAILVYVLSVPNIVGVIVPEYDFTTEFRDDIKVVKAEIFDFKLPSGDGDGENYRAETEMPPKEVIEVDVPPDPLANTPIGSDDPNIDTDVEWDPNGGGGDPSNDPDGDGSGSRFNDPGTIGSGDGDGSGSMEVFEWAEVQPEINMEALARSIRYPDIARRNNIEGTVLVRVLVGKDGWVVRSEIVSSDNELLNEAAVEGVEAVPFKPATQNGMQVNCWVVVPVQFRLGR